MEMNPLQGLFVLLFLGTLLWTAVEDWRTRVIANRIPLFLMALGVPVLWLFPEHSILERLAGSLAVSLPMLLLTLLIPGGFGGGDIKLMFACGWLLGWKAILNAMILAILLGGICAAGMLLSGKRKRRDSFAFGPFLALGVAGAVLFWGR